MEDEDLQQIRAKRLAQLESQYRGGSDANGTEERRKREQDEMKNTVLTQVLTQSARARLNTLMIGKPEKGQLVENMLIQMARTGQIMGKLNESELIDILEKVSEQMQQRTTVKFDRRRAAVDSDDDY
ncbi:programmed cell death protein 5 [Cryptotermes secundus]|uniref:programmed cell death protein 5 n=1 Tax=Cryptotermes secundus TaxID=105785 RepID=UPI000CD7BCD0|nr:programmed cell death protein 5 [Cryptotermes secundus]